MRLAVSGTSCLGKSTLIKDFVAEWPTYKTESSTYRDLIKSKNYPHSKNVTKEGQWGILNCMIDELQKHDENDNIIYDRCPLDCLVYSLWAYEHKTSDIDDNFISQIIPIVKNSLHYLDIIWFIPISKFNRIPIENDGMREVDPEYIEEIDNIFKGLFFQYQKNLDSNVFFDNKNCPAIIEVFGSREERIQYMRNYLDATGNLIGEENSVLSEENLTDMYNLLKGQEEAGKRESSEKHQRNLIKKFINSTKQ